MVTRFALLQEYGGTGSRRCHGANQHWQQQRLSGPIERTRSQSVSSDDGHVLIHRAGPFPNFRTRDRKIVAVDSDGNLTLNLGVLGTIANEAPKNLTIC